MEKPYYVTSEDAKRILILSASQIFAAYVGAGKLNETNEKELVVKSVQSAIKITQEVTEKVKTVSR